MKCKWNIRNVINFFSKVVVGFCFCLKSSINYDREMLLNEMSRHNLIPFLKIDHLFHLMWHILSWWHMLFRGSTIERLMYPYQVGRLRLGLQNLKIFHIPPLKAVTKFYHLHLRKKVFPIEKKHQTEKNSSKRVRLETQDWSHLKQSIHLFGNSARSKSMLVSNANIFFLRCFVT